MSIDYSKKKNAELEELLKARSLPHTGKKADLIARLVQNDSEKKNSVPSTSTAPADDEIDWDDDAITDAPPSATNKPKDPPAASSASGAYALASGGIGRVANPTAVPNQKVATDPSSTNDLTVIPPDPATSSNAEADPSTTVTPDPAPPPAADTTTTNTYSRDVPPTELEVELEKRKARAKRFGLADQESNTDTIKTLERAKRFGTGDANALSSLDKALPDRGARKRGREDGTEGSNKRADSGRRGRERGGGRRGGGGGAGSRQNGQGQRNGSRRDQSGHRDRREKDGSKNKVGQNEKDRLAAEARKKRFASSA